MKLSIITINLNNLAGLKSTVNSVLNQSFTDYEYIVIDGGSTDGSKEFLENISSRLTFWQSEKDKGIYNAMNIGIENASGEYLLFLNSGDYLNENILQQIEGELINDIIYGDLEFRNGVENYVMKYPNILSFNYFLKKSLPHPATFIKKELFLKFRLYDIEMKICSDWAFFIELICVHNVSYRHIPVTISSFDTNGLSSNIENWETIENEKTAYLQSTFPAFLIDYQYNEKVRAQYNALKRSRVRKILSVFFKQLRF